LKFFDTFKKRLFLFHKYDHVNRKMYELQDNRIRILKQKRMLNAKIQRLRFDYYRFFAEKTFCIDITGNVCQCNNKFVTLSTGAFL